jgi:hypothetical protein
VTSKVSEGHIRSLLTFKNLLFIRNLKIESYEKYECKYYEDVQTNFS